MTEISFSYGDSWYIFINLDSNAIEINCDNNLAIIKRLPINTTRGCIATHI